MTFSTETLLDQNPLEQTKQDSQVKGSWFSIGGNNESTTAQDIQKSNSSKGSWFSIGGSSKPQTHKQKSSETTTTSKPNLNDQAVAWGSRPSRTAPTTKTVIQGVDVGYMKPIIDILDKYKITYQITSGYRPWSTNELSWHKVGHGLDIVPRSGISNDDFIRQFVGNKELLDELKRLGYGILNEYIPEMMIRTKATGPHLHIGPDRLSRDNHMLFYNKNMPLYSKWW